MTYSTDIDALGNQHRWSFDGNSTDSVGTANGTDSGVIYTNTAICEGSTNCMTTNTVTDRVTLPTTTDINNSAQTRKAFGGWFVVTAIQPPPKRIYGEGNHTTCFQFVFAYGNNVMFEVAEPTNFTLQIYGPPLQPNRIYHLFGVFEGNGFANEVKFFVDGVEQFNASPSNRQPNTPDLDIRGVGEFGDPAGTVGIGADAVILNAPVNGKYNQWVSFDGASAQLTDIEIRETLFEKGAIPTNTIVSDTEANMQTALNLLSGTIRPDAPLCIRVEDSTTVGANISLTFDNITFDKRASIHVQWMGTGTLTVVNKNGSDVSITSTPNNGTVNIIKTVNLTVKVEDASDFSVIQGARVRIIADTGGSLAVGTEILQDVTDVNGEVTATFSYVGDQPYKVKVRRSTTNPLYKTSLGAGTITENGISIIQLMVKDT
jgi:hypothetical protein